MPAPVVALPCGSRSTRSTRRFIATRLAARLTAVVVLPTPPFWFAIAMIRGIMNAPPGSPLTRRRAPPRGGGERLGAARRRSSRPHHDQVARSVEPRHVEPALGDNLDVAGELRELLAGMHALHRVERPA